MSYNEVYWFYPQMIFPRKIFSVYFHNRITNHERQGKVIVACDYKYHKPKRASTPT